MRAAQCPAVIEACLVVNVAVEMCSPSCRNSAHVYNGTPKFTVAVLSISPHMTYALTLGRLRAMDTYLRRILVLSKTTSSARLCPVIY